MLRILMCLTGIVFLVNCNSLQESYSLKYNDMQDFSQMRWEQDSTVLVLAGNATVLSRPLKLKRGKYVLQFKAVGNIAVNIKPHFVIHLQDFEIVNTGIDEGLNSYTFKFELPETMEAPFRFTFDNDYNDEKSDRNIFLYYPVLIKPYSW